MRFGDMDEQVAHRVCQARRVGKAQPEDHAHLADDNQDAGARRKTDDDGV